MDWNKRWLMNAAFGGAVALLTSCSAPQPEKTPPGPMARRLAVERLTAVVVTNRKTLNGPVGGRLRLNAMAGDTDGGSATPIAPDGYFITADHVLAQSPGRRIFLVYRNGGAPVHAPARVVWRSSASDLALVHAPIATPYFYRWSPSEKWVPAGTPVIHGGLATGMQSSPGKLTTHLPPESPFSGARTFKIDVPLKPGDSGGPVLNAKGELLGINSAVEYLIPMETPFFLDSECSRPSIRALESIIEQDRRNAR